MDKGIRCNLRSQWELDTWQVRGHQVDPYLLPNQFGRERKREKRGNRKKEGEREFRVRSSHFSLDFSAIKRVASGETRGKVDPHGKGYTWVPVLWSFDNSER